MIHAYDKIYLDKACIALGRMLDFAVYDLNYDIGEFFDLFMASGVARRFEQGDATVLVGKSGVELVYEVEWSLGKQSQVRPKYAVNRSPEYWAGWALAYYQWESSLRFSEILRCVPIKEIVAMYSPYHEMDIRQFVDKMNELYLLANSETNLKRLRRQAGLSQKGLAEDSGVPLRTIQQYEQRQKSINKAQVMYAVKLAKALGCEVEELLEKVE